MNNMIFVLALASLSLLIYFLVVTVPQALMFAWDSFRPDDPMPVHIARAIVIFYVIATANYSPSKK